MKFTIDTLIGAAILVVLMSIFLTPGGAATVIYMSVVCTAGISLVIWIPLANGVGKIVRYLINRDREELKPTMPSISANRRRAIETYVANATFQGMPLDKIASQLDALGWSRQEIEQVIGPDEPAR